MDKKGEIDRKRRLAWERGRLLNHLQPGSPEAIRETIAALTRYKCKCYASRRHSRCWLISWVPAAWMKFGGSRCYRRFVHEETARRWLIKIVVGLPRAQVAHEVCKLYPDPIDEEVQRLNSQRSPDSPRATRKDAINSILRTGLYFPPKEVVPSCPTKRSHYLF